MLLSSRLKESFILIVDSLALLACLVGAFHYRFGFLPEGQDSSPLRLIIPSVIFTNYLFDQYKLNRRAFAIFRLLTKAICLFIAFIFVTMISYLFLERSGFLGRGILPISLVAYFIVSTFLILIFDRLKSIFPTKNKVVFFLESSEQTERIQKDLNYINVFDIHQFFCKDKIGEKEIVPALNNYLTTLKKDVNNHTLVLESSLINPSLFETLFKSRVQGAKIYKLSRFHEKFFDRIPMDNVDQQELILSGNFNLTNNPSTQRYKRSLDLILGIPLFIISLPIIFTCALFVKLTSKGPALFSQNRVGKNEKIFKIHKLRTMRVDAEKNGAQWATENDSRITALGKILRKTRLDELPQIWNVIKGDMSFVGPRPERPEFIKTLEEHIPHYGLRHLVKPGISGWAQVNYPYGASVNDSKEKLSYDLFYVKNYNILLDLYVYVKTIKIMLHFSGR